MDVLVSVDPASDETCRSSGGKAAVLLELQAAGFPIPDFVVSPEDLAAVVRDLGFPLVVRSSASVEDGRAASFAGQFRSYLGLGSLQQVQEAIRQCRASAMLPSVTEYCRRNGVDPSSIRLDVIVQRMVGPELAGVAFTVNPVTGTEEVVIEACPGLADLLLAGHAPPLPADHPLLIKYGAEITNRRPASHAAFRGAAGCRVRHCRRRLVHHPVAAYHAHCALRRTSANGRRPTFATAASPAGCAAR